MIVCGRLKAVLVACAVPLIMQRGSKCCVAVHMYMYIAGSMCSMSRKKETKMFL